MKFNKEEKEWLEKCKANPKKYNLAVDNDCISVDNTELEESVFTFNEFGYSFAVQLLNYIGCKADFV